MKNIKLFAIANTIGLILVLVLNTLANVLPINGMTTGALSDAYPNLFVPAGFTFSIWGVIYIALIAFIFYQIKQAFSRRNAPHHFITKIGWLFFISCLANAGWILAWHYQYIGLSLGIMVTILASLMGIYLSLEIGIDKKRANSSEKAFVHIPFSIYLGWITVATIANVTTFLVDLGWTGFGVSEAIWAAIMLAIGTVIGLKMLQNRKDTAFALVLVWAYFGIVYKRMSIDAELYNSVTIVGIIGIILLIIGIIWNKYRK